MLKPFWLALLALASAVAIAQPCVVEGAFGGGAAGAPDASNPNAHFGLNVVNASCADRQFQAGAFRLATRQENRLVEIQMVRLERLEVDIENRTATFVGPAVMTVRTREGVRHVRGAVRVRVHDNRPRSSTEGPPDTIAVQFFVPDREDPAFAYRGAVMQGDILVFRHERSR
ncbi:MAG: hypothetical protein NZL85_07600 [Fimbriimonadales bacterium]|nr:hypothetical protein [Fimbriimonadales bacterium]